MDASQVLVIILATFLALFLLLAIVLTILFIRIAMQIKRVTTVAEQAAFKFDTILSVAQKAVAPAMLAKLVNDVAQRFMDRNKKRDD
jgi:hypothetical protein